MGTSWQDHPVAQLVAKWDGPKAKPTKAQRAGDEVSAEERARRVAEYELLAPPTGRLDALEKLAGTGVITAVRRVGRGRYTYFRCGKFVEEGQP